jgi:DNA topoisomerase-2
VVGLDRRSHDIMENDTASENMSIISNSKASNVLSDSAVSALSPHNGQKAKSKSIEETYTKLSQLDHVLLRPDTYIGSTEKQEMTLWVHDGERMINRNVNVAPGLYKIFDEILVNAADNKVRDPTMNTLKVDIDIAERTVKVLNNGAGVPVEVHKTEGIYVPELIFGNLLTSSNYNDKEKKVTGGRNGYGAKLANIFSSRFIVETCDGKRKKRYRQVFEDNMTVKNEPDIKACKATDNWTCITFRPDLQRFGMEDLEEDIVSLMRKRVYDMAGILGKGVKVYFNGEKLPVKDFQSYVEMYLGKDTPKTYAKVGERWEVCMAASDGQFNQISFANAICTTKGGTHVNYVADQAVKYLCETLSKKHKQAGIKPFMVKNYLWVFVNCLVENPAFDSQTKDTLTLRASAFGSKCQLTDSFLKKLSGCGITDAILSFASFKANKELKKGDGAKRQRLIGIPKLDDANEAGGRNSKECTLILTEGDSAKSLAISGLSVVGRDKYGVFPLRGKLLNVRDASASQITGNAEINNIKQILGLQHGKVYDDVKSLRYGHLMVMTDQDHDGSHIKGLIMNFLHHFYPSLLKIPGFLIEFITPIIKVTKGKEAISFFTLPEYENWCEKADTKGWKVKYYKGLGTSTAAEAKEYFASISKHRKEFVWEGEDDGKSLEMAFSKKKVEERKDWLRSFVPGTFLDHEQDTISYSDFVHKELILFSRADLERSIPNIMDGLKPGQRKIMFACFKRNLKNDIKVAQLAGYVAEHSAYHHGENSLNSTIVGLAQNFAGSNNINTLVPQGQFGTRLQGGKDSASPRYIFTRLAQITRSIFHPGDDPLLNYLNEEGQTIEPEYYAPVLPLVLVNGAEGIGTGWSTSIPNYNPRDIVVNLMRMLDGEECGPLQPWYSGFRGKIEESISTRGLRSYTVSGIISQIDDTTLEITELPLKKWTQDYKEFLEELAKPEGKKEPFIIDYKEHHTDTSVHFVINMSPEKMKEALDAGLYAKFKLTSKLSITNMMLFDSTGTIKKYDGPEEIVKEFFDVRLEMYRMRKSHLLRVAEAELLRISNKARFILAVVAGELVLSNRKKADIVADLEASGYDKLSTNQKKPADISDEDHEASMSSVSYDYLLNMSLSSLTLEKVEALKKQEAECREGVETLQGTSEAQMWRDDLDAFLEAYAVYEEEEYKRELLLARQQEKARKAEIEKAKTAKNGKGKKGAAKKKKKDEWSSDEESDFDDFSEDEDVLVRIPRRAPPPRGPVPKVTGPEPKATKSSKSSKSSKTQAPGSSLLSDGKEPEPSASSAGVAQHTEEMSLMARMARRMNEMDIGADQNGPATSTASVKKPTADGKKKTALKKSINSATSKLDKPIAKVKPALSADDGLSSSDEEVSDIVQIAPRVAPRRRAAAAARPVYVDSASDEDEGAQSDSSSVTFSSGEESEEESDYCPSD